MRLSPFFGKSVKTLEVNLTEYFNEDEFINTLKKEKIDALQIHQSLFCKQVATDLDFLEHIPDKDRIKKMRIETSIKDEDTFRKLYAFKNLDTLYVVNSARQAFHIDVSPFTQLFKLCIYGNFVLEGLDKIHLKQLFISYNKYISEISFGSTIEYLNLYQSKSIPYEQLSKLTELRNLVFIQVPIQSLNGYGIFRNLENMEVAYCRNLTDISGITDCPLLRKLEIDCCKKIEDFNCLSKLKNLEGLIISNCGNIPSIAFIDDMPKLRFFSFVDTNIVDGDLTPCMRLEYVGTMDKRHYNIKAENLPHRHIGPFQDL